MLPVGCSVAGSARVSNLLGANNPTAALIASNVSIISAAFLSFCMGSILWFVPHPFFPSLFDPDKRVISETVRTIPFLCAYVFADGIQVALNGVIKGCGKQPVIMPIVIVAYWVIGLPIAYHFSFGIYDGTTICEDHILCGITGLTAGLTVGTYTHLILLFILVVCTTDWVYEATLAQKRLDVDGNEKDRSIDAFGLVMIDKTDYGYDSIE